MAVVRLQRHCLKLYCDWLLPLLCHYSVSFYYYYYCYYYYGSTALFCAFAAFSVSWTYTQSVRLFGRGISPSQSLYLHRTIQTQNKRRQTFMSRVEFEPTNPGFERANTVHALDGVATTIGTVIQLFDAICSEILTVTLNDTSDKVRCTYLFAPYC
jgi:hypothetical protein